MLPKQARLRKSSQGQKIENANDFNIRGKNIEALKPNRKQK